MLQSHVLRHRLVVSSLRPRWQVSQRWLTSSSESSTNKPDGTLSSETGPVLVAPTAPHGNSIDNVGLNAGSLANKDVQLPSGTDQGHSRLSQDLINSQIRKADNLRAGVVKLVDYIDRILYGAEIALDKPESELAVKKTDKQSSKDDTSPFSGHNTKQTDATPAGLEAIAAEQTVGGKSPLKTPEKDVRERAKRAAKRERERSKKSSIEVDTVAQTDSKQLVGENQSTVSSTQFATLRERRALQRAAQRVKAPIASSMRLHRKKVPVGLLNSTVTVQEPSKEEMLAAKSLTAAQIQFKTLEVDQPEVRKLSYDLERVLFKRGVYNLQDERTGVFNFDHYLQNIMPNDEFDFDSLGKFITSSKDTVLQSLARDHGQKYVGSTSSMTSVLAHFHYLLSNFRPLNLDTISSGYESPPTTFTRFTRIPASMYLKYKDGVYAIDADKEFDRATVLSHLGQSLEKLLTLPKETYEQYRKTNPDKIPEEIKKAPEAYHYSSLANFLFRSQLDGHHEWLPGTGIFDIKTRACIAVRHDQDNVDEMSGYRITELHGEWESYEREYLDMLRGTMLKYSLQARMGRMDGIFVAYHNTSQIFGFQYIPVSEMDKAIHGQEDLALGDQEFKFSVQMYSDVLDLITKHFPNQSLRLIFETVEPSSPGHEPVMRIFAKPVDTALLDSVRKAQAEQDMKDFKEGVLSEEMVHESVSSERTNVSRSHLEKEETIRQIFTLDAKHNHPVEHKPSDTAKNLISADLAENEELPSPALDTSRAESLKLEDDTPSQSRADNSPQDRSVSGNEKVLEILEEVELTPTSDITALGSGAEKDGPPVSRSQLQGEAVVPEVETEAVLPTQVKTAITSPEPMVNNTITSEDAHHAKLLDYAKETSLTDREPLLADDQVIEAPQGMEDVEAAPSSSAGSLMPLESLPATGQGNTIFKYRKISSIFTPTRKAAAALIPLWRTVYLEKQLTQFASIRFGIPVHTVESSHRREELLIQAKLNHDPLELVAAQIHNSIVSFWESDETQAGLLTMIDISSAIEQVSTAHSLLLTADYFERLRDAVLESINDGASMSSVHEKISAKGALLSLNQRRLLYLKSLPIHAAVKAGLSGTIDQKQQMQMLSLQVQLAMLNRPFLYGFIPIWNDLCRLHKAPKVAPKQVSGSENPILGLTLRAQHIIGGSVLSKRVRNVKYSSRWPLPQDKTTKTGLHEPTEVNKEWTVKYTLHKISDGVAEKLFTRAVDARRKTFESFRDPKNGDEWFKNRIKEYSRRGQEKREKLEREVLGTIKEIK